jgi:hypothetical protein
LEDLEDWVTSTNTLTQGGLIGLSIGEGKIGPSFGDFIFKNYV